VKNILSLIFGILFTGTLFAQGSIQGYTIEPPSPGTSDYVRVYVDVMFTSGGCAVYTQGQVTTSNVTDAFALHCLGQLAVICNATDTFNLGYLEAGNHVFNFTLSSGIGGPPCTPGIVADDAGSTNFTVSIGTGIINDEAEVQDIAIYPNPFNTVAKIKIDDELRFNKAEMKIIDFLGRTVKIIDAIQTYEFTLDRVDLVNGIYFYQLTEKEKTLAAGKFIIE
jgi:hypothetical protein